MSATVENNLHLNKTDLYNILLKHSNIYAPLVPFNSRQDRILIMDFTASNTRLTDEVIGNMDQFTSYIEQLLKGYSYGIGGYNELRTVYSRSRVFDTMNEPRRLHLGIDIWGPAGTVVSAPLDGFVHSIAFNDNYGDYGATIILQHQLDGITFHTLYGHVSLDDLKDLQEGLQINSGQPLAHFGKPHENGNWPPHLHFQIIETMNNLKGDYPGVCKFSERDQYLANSPDADIVVQMMQYAQTTRHA